MYYTHINAISYNASLVLKHQKAGGKCRDAPRAHGLFRRVKASDESDALRRVHHKQ